MSDSVSNVVIKEEQKVTSNIRLLMAYNGYKSLRSLGDEANVSWEILKKLDENTDIDTIVLENILKIAKVLNCTFEDLINIPYRKTKDYSNYRKTKKYSNANILMALNSINTMKELERLSGVSWKIIKKLSTDEEDIMKTQLKNLIKVSSVLNCKITDLINIDYDYQPIKFFNITTTN